jgi:hypothetical protein
MTEAERLEYAIRVNSERRHLTRIERARLLDRLVLAAPTKSTREVADMLKVGKSTVGRIKQKVLAGVPDATPGTIQGRHGKTYRARAATSVETLAHARIVPPLFEEVAATTGGISPRGLKRLARESIPALPGSISAVLPSGERIRMASPWPTSRKSMLAIFFRSRAGCPQAVAEDDARTKLRTIGRRPRRFIP